MTGHKVRPQPRGYILLTVVVMIAIAATILARLANRSMRLATIAVAEEREMRSRWALISLKRYSFDRAANLYTRGESRQGVASDGVRWQDLNLAGETWRIVIADESSKLNLVKYVNEVDGESFRNDVSSLLGASSACLSTDRSWGRGGWEEWLAHSDRSRSLSAAEIASATQRLTLWGDGRLNVIRSDLETVDTVWKRLFGHAPPATIYELRQREQPPTTEQMLASLSLRESQRDIAAKWLCAESRCYSSWVFCQTDHRIRASLFIEWEHPGTGNEYRGYQY